jgi:hypothetical protein
MKINRQSLFHFLKALLSKVLPVPGDVRNIPLLTRFSPSLRQP